jgi:two-component sensor histidine kinase
VAVDWTTGDRDHPEWLRVTWRESGGPPVRAPGRRGFGSRLVEQSLAGVGGRVTVTYDAAGLVCILECPRE